MNLQGRGFAGFGAKQRYDSRNGIWETTGYARNFPNTGMVSSGTATQNNSSAQTIWGVQNTLTATTLDATANNERYFPYVSTSILNNYEVGGPKNTQLITSSNTNYGTPDAYGNFASVTTVVTDEDTVSPYYGNTWTSTIANTFAPQAGSTWCLNLPTQTTVTKSSSAPGGAAITRTIAYNNPDYTNCRQTEKVTEPNGGIYKVVEDYVYDGFGNLYTDTVTGSGMAPRVTTINWTANGQFPQTITKPLSQSITLGFDPNTGMMISQTDPNYTTANPLKTTWTYDNFARKTQENRPDGTYTVWTYNDCASYGGCLFGSHALALSHYIYNYGGSIQSDGTTYFDQIDRPVIANNMMLSGAWDRNEVRYDSLGRVVQQAMPCVWTSVPTLCPYWTTNSFDLLNRLTQSQRPISATNSSLQTTTIQYAGRTTTVTDPPTTADPQGRITTRINLVTGRLARTQDHTGYYINFNYDAFGSLLSVKDSLSNTLNTMTYDYGLQAFLRTSNDTDLGPRSNTYDALGELTAYSDAKGQNFSVIYDALSRPTNRTEPDLTTTWTWGTTAASFNIGKLQSVAAASSVGTYSETYTYDSKTRLSTKQITIPGDTTYTYTSTYNQTTGLLDTLQYPVSTSGNPLTLQYSYQNGILQQISDVATGTHYWTANATNPRGQLTQETLGNNVVVNHALDSVTGWPSSIQAGVGGGATLQNNSYLFDAVGNLTQRQDNNLGVTENAYPDSLYRLNHTIGDTNTQISYDSMGRIATWAAYGGSPNVKDYTTPQPGCPSYANSQLHAVRSNTQSGSSYSPVSFCYDANGNVIKATYGSAATKSMTWTSYNQPSDISGGSSSSQFFYNADHQRYKQIASYSGAPETTFYVGGLLEKMINSSGTTYRHYIPAGNNTVVYTRLSTGTNSTYYLTKDHLGSTAVITDSTGTSLVSEKFAALGWNENTAAEQATMATVTRHEFTGHEGLDNTGIWLVNMNGRIYDPSGSMFLSPDPNVQDPGNTQNFNRYSYVNNNPLTYTDPSGFLIFQPYWGDLSGSSGFTSGLPDSGPEIVVTSTRGSWQTVDTNQAIGALTSPTPDPQTSNSGDSLEAIVVTGKKTPPVQPPPPTLLAPLPITVPFPQLPSVAQGDSRAQSQNPITKFRNFICSAPAVSAGVKIQLNYGFLSLFGAEGQVSLSVTSHGQVVWTQTGGGVAGVNQGLILSGGLQGGYSSQDAPSGFSTVSTLGGEVIATAGEGFGASASASTDGSGLNVDALGSGSFATGVGVVSGANYQTGLAVATPSLCP